MSILSESLSRIKPSPTMAVVKKATELRSAGKDIISLGAGEPDFDTPENIKQAAIEAIKDGKTKYTVVDGTIELKRAVIGKFKRENNLIYNEKQVTVGVGGKHVIFNAILATINPGDEVLIPAPYWVSYPDIVLLAGGTPVIVECEESADFKILPEQIEKNVTKNTKWIILNSPSNPTGSVYSEQELKDIGEVLKKFPNVHIMSDDIYEHVLYTKNKFFTIAQIPELFSRTLTINGLSKSYAMTGWRVGYAGGPENIIQGIAKIQSQSTTNTSSISQAAAEEALNGTQDFIKKRSDAFKERRDFVVKKLNSIEGLSCKNPEGAFYVFPNCKDCIGKKDINKKEIVNDADFVTSLLENTGVAVVQGSAFGKEGYFRISYATSMKNLSEALDKIEEYCKQLS
ncbi:aspartate aminotransferase [Candidatus Pelagibacter sp. IMCC9063]|uniref:pyridoxal phosphate-dependent aminotransferase n=1 Tax=Pelagibacter sp. (strain IMCC9063) TaxID=1002672 RepID=UPI00020464F3|nr:pyridoxal phosphate-dependent aminotransferase [Candidatus Pelagibacter sp. IMCC9063]AEA81210.1 aspartate aminotransferase [Candidatus Pelagibacter sp. IMCC9063]